MRQFAVLLAVLFLPWAAAAEPLRFATFNTELSRKGPGLLLRDLERGRDAQVLAVLRTIVAADADVIALQGLDWDFDQRTLVAFNAELAKAGLLYPYSFTARPNAGRPSGMDLDGDEELNGPGDSLGWGRFTGFGGLAILSRWPLDSDQLIDLTDLLWADFPLADMPRHADGTPFPSQAAWEVMRLSSSNHWAIPVLVSGVPPIWVLTFHAAPPVFDGPEDRNGRRNADEIRLWQHVLDGHMSLKETNAHSSRSVFDGRFVVLADANLDPVKGEGRKGAIRTLLADPRLQDVVPTDPKGDAHTVVWQSTGPMRVDYALPSRGFQVVGSGILRNEISRHGLVWVDILP